MQKKSLLVALFCGALCLTGCLKNEESASVAQVRIAKANELNSLADLNKAKAQAEVIYANAEATIAQAEAKLREANAALVLAKAETEKVRAELLKVRVKLAEVEVAEEEVELQRKEAELEVYLAQYEAEIAQAEAAKQAWVNTLNILLNQAEIDAIKGAQKLLEAQEDLASYVLTLEAQSADSAKKYANLYFTAYDEVQKLQKQQIQTKATKALVEAGAKEIRDAIYDAIDDIDEQIAEKEALVAYLKEYQTKSPEEAEAALKEATEDLNEAYNAYLEALSDQNDAEKALRASNEKTADFVQNWRYNFDNKFIDTEIYELIDFGSIEVTYGEGEAAQTKLLPKTSMKVRGITVKVDDEEKFIPFWHEEDNIDDPARYPDVDVYTMKNIYGKWTTEDFVILNRTLYAPATIYYDNIEKALDYAIANKEKESKDAIAKEEKDNAKAIETHQNTLDWYKDSLDLHQKYVAARATTVADAEQAYLDALAESESKSEDILTAWKEFEVYMFTKYHGIDRDRFIDIFEADTTLQGLARDTTAKKTDLETKKAVMEGETGLKAKVKAAFEAYAKAEGDLRKAYDSLFTAGTEAYIKAGQVEEAASAWDPKFAASKDQLRHVPENLTDAVDTTWYKGQIKAGTAQNAALSAALDYETAQKNYYRTQIDFLRGLKTQAQLTDALHAEEAAQRASTEASNRENEAKDAYDDRTSELADILGVEKIENLFAAFNPEFLGGSFAPVLNIKNIFEYGVTFPTEAKPTPERYDIKTTGSGSYIHYDDEDKEWYSSSPRKVAGTAQAALFDAVQAAENQQRAISRAQNAFDAAKIEAVNAENALETAQKRLIAELEGLNWNSQIVRDTINAERVVDYMDEDAQKLYGKYTAAKEEKVASEAEAWAALQKAYGEYPDQVAAHIDANRNSSPRDFDWIESSFNDDYTSTSIGRYGKVDTNAVKLRGYLKSKVDENKDSLDAYGNKIPNYTSSLKYLVEEETAMIKVVLPKQLEDFKMDQAREVETFKSDAAKIITFFNGYKAHWNGYKDWVTERVENEKAFNEAKKVAFDTKQEYKDAKAEYDAVKAVANEGMWVYDPQKEINGWANQEGFTFIKINDAIANLEGESVDLFDIVQALNSTIGKATVSAASDLIIDEKDVQTIISKIENRRGRNNQVSIGASQQTVVVATNEAPEITIAELNFIKKALQEALKYGKISLQVIVEAFDDEIAELDEKIDVYTAIANIYKTLMNAYLGIVPNDDETGPLDGEGEGEGDDEE